jgi:hypothetical protein
MHHNRKAWQEDHQPKAMAEIPVAEIMQKFAMTRHRKAEYADAGADKRGADDTPKSSLINQLSEPTGSPLGNRRRISKAAAIASDICATITGAATQPTPNRPVTRTDANAQAAIRDHQNRMATGLTMQSAPRPQARGSCCRGRSGQNWCPIVRKGNRPAPKWQNRMALGHG